MAQVVAEKGYAEVSVADVVRAAGVSRATFYELFADKEACFLYGFQKLSAAHQKTLQAELDRELPLPERLLAAITAYIKRIDVDRVLARAFIAEAEGATPRSRLAMLDAQGRLHLALRQWLQAVCAHHPEVAVRSDADVSLVMTGLIGHVMGKVRRDEGFSPADVQSVLRFVLAGLGLYGWARHVELGMAADRESIAHACPVSDGG